MLAVGPGAELEEARCRRASGSGRGRHRLEKQREDL